MWPLCTQQTDKYIAISTNIENAERVRPLSKQYNFNYSIRLQSACGYQSKLQTNYAVLTFCDFKHRVIVFTLQIKPCLK